MIGALSITALVLAFASEETSSEDQWWWASKVPHDMLTRFRMAFALDVIQDGSYTVRFDDKAWSSRFEDWEEPAREEALLAVMAWYLDDHRYSPILNTSDDKGTHQLEVQVCGDDVTVMGHWSIGDLDEMIRRTLKHKHKIDDDELTWIVDSIETEIEDDVLSFTDRWLATTSGDRYLATHSDDIDTTELGLLGLIQEIGHQYDKLIAEKEENKAHLEKRILELEQAYLKHLQHLRARGEDKWL